MLYAMVAVSLTVLTGWAGQLSLGQFAFVGLGAMTTAALVREGVGFVPALAFATLVGTAAAMVIGTPSLRRPGLFLAVSTLAFAVMTSSWLLFRPVFVPDGVVPVRLPRQIVGERVARLAGDLLPGLPGHARSSCSSACRGVRRVVARPLDDRGARQRAGRRVVRHLAGPGEAHRVRHRRRASPGWPAACSAVSS